MEKIVIIGGVAAGTKTAAKLRRLNPDAQIDIYTEDTHVSYSTCGFPYFIGGNFDEEAYLYARTVEEFEKSGIHIHLKSKCDRIDTQAKIVYGNGFEAPYDKLMIATGAVPFVPNIKNVGLKNVFTLRHVEDALAIKERAANCGHVTVVGGGYIGVELMEAFVKRGMKVTLVEASPFIMSTFDDDMAELIQKYVLAHCNDEVEIINNDMVTEFVGTEAVEKVMTAKGKEIATDFVVICAGVRPNVELAKSCGVELGVTGAIKVDERMRTNIEDVYAAGDCAEKFHIVSRKNCWIPMASTAIKEGRCAAINMSGAKDYFFGVVGSGITKYFDFTMGLAGLNEKDAKRYGFEPVSAIVRKSDKVDYMPDAKEIIVKVVADKHTRNLLGIQTIGYGNADKRVSTFVPALNCHFT
ncbi:FAD-dependent oxidoreductase, partial [bacterium]|nr:FAD-dependent oxidoreductase [bacterium]